MGSNEIRELILFLATEVTELSEENSKDSVLSACIVRMYTCG